jgi:hypothetical protein
MQLRHTICFKNNGLLQRPFCPEVGEEAGLLMCCRERAAHHMHKGNDFTSWLICLVKFDCVVLHFVICIRHGR